MAVRMIARAALSRRCHGGAKGGRAWSHGGGYFQHDDVARENVTITGPNCAIEASRYERVAGRYAACPFVTVNIAVTVVVVESVM